ncbi:hypothetical protein [Emticicia sp. SJ17W-69]|uniref:hypothetical protein n=1 Tax=Emticicia sp. SJ17W-69 TaxID=3421657 RepID=UPI003EBDC5F6
MTKILIHLFLSNIYFCAFADITITVKVKNASPNTSISIISEYYDLDKRPLEVSSLDKQGIGILKTTVKNKRLLIVDIGFKVVPILVNPGNNYIITYDNKERIKINFDGDNSKMNTFLHECENFITNFQYNGKPYIDWEPLIEFPQGMDSLENLISKNISVFLENNTINQNDSKLLSEFFSKFCFD